MNYKCNECNGKGTRDTRNDPVVWLFGSILPPNTKCKKCLGTGNLNWIENIFGKENARVEEIKRRLERIITPVDVNRIDPDSLTPMTDYLSRKDT